MAVQIKDSPTVLMRNAQADKWYPKYREALHRLILSQYMQAGKRVREGANESTMITDSLAYMWQQEMIDVKQNFVYNMVAEGYLLAGKEFGKAAIIRTGSTEYGFGLMGPEEGFEFLLQSDIQNLDEWLEETSKIETATTRKRIQKAYEDAASFYDPELQRGMTPKEIAKEIINRGVTQSVARSVMLARTGTIWAYNEGAQQRYKREGVVAKEWLVTADDLTCEFCLSMSGEVIPIDSSFVNKGEEVQGVEGGVLGPAPFNIDHPPVHPHCRCALIPVVDTTNLRIGGI